MKSIHNSTYPKGSINNLRKKRANRLESKLKNLVSFCNLLVFKGKISLHSSEEFLITKELLLKVIVQNEFIVKPQTKNGLPTKI